MKKILIYGIGSLKNRGCEALVNSSIYQIDPKVELSVATFNYKEDKNMFKDRIKKTVNHYKNKEEEFTKQEKEEYEKIKQQPFDYNNYELFYERDVIKELEKADLAIHIGGDNYCYGVNEWMYAINTKAKELGKKTVLWGASLFEEIKDLDLIHDLEKYDLLMLRESISYNAVKKYIPETKLLLTPDPAFSLKPKKINLNPWYKNKKIIGLNLSPLTIKTEENQKAVYNFIDYILEKTDYQILLISHVTVEEASDLTILSKIKEHYSEEDRIYLEKGNYNCQELKYIISQLDFLIAARTHASIAGYSSNVPTLVIGYSVKSKGIAKDIFGTYKNYVLPKENLVEDNLINHFFYLEKKKEEIKDILDKKIKTHKKEASTLYKQMIDKLNNQTEREICKTENCVGCGLCKKICPKDAIVWKTDKDGFKIPQIDLKKCIHCDLCRKTCPVLNEKKKTDFTPICYAAKNKDSEIQKQSTSGGVFSLFADYILKNGGIVYGAWENNFKVKHIRIDRKEDLYKIRGSKYIQSNLEEVLPLIEKDLKENKKVLFSGTPCQVAAINKLAKDHKNLITISVICHGVLSEVVLNKYIKEKEQQKDVKMQEFIYRTKENGWSKASIKCKYKNGEEEIIPFNESALMGLFNQNSILRESCYHCKLKEENNASDIILGDYWGIGEVDKEMFDDNGVSTIIIKSKKGKELLESIVKEEKITIKISEEENIKKCNPAYTKSPTKPLRRYTVMDDIEKNSLELIYQCDKDQIIIEELEQKIEMLKKDQNNSKVLIDELNAIKGSKRWKVTDKMANAINKIIKRKRK